MTVGIRAHDLNQSTPDTLAREVSRLGLNSVQLALNRSFAIENKPGALNPGLAYNIGTAFKKHEIQISILGCYGNIIHPDKTQRKTLLDTFKEHIRFARDLGCGMVGTETGNVNPQIIYDEANFTEQPFLEVISSVEELVSEAEKFGVIVGIEPGVNHPIYSPRTMKRLLESIASNNLQVIFDPVNLLTAENHHDQHAIFQEALDLWGDRISAMHIKDYHIIDGKLQPAPVGKGLMDYEYIFRDINKRKPMLNMILDEISIDHIDYGKKYIQGLAVNLW